MAEEQPPVKYAMAFFDGQNLFQHAKEAAVCVANGWTPNAIRFYTGVPSPFHAEMWAGYWSNRIIAMKRAGIITTTRPLRYHDEEVVIDGVSQLVATPQEKGIDVRLALDLVACTLREEFHVAVVYSQDQDLAEAVIEVKAIAKKANRDIEVACAYPSGPKASSSRGIDKTTWIRIEEETYNACLDPRDYRPKRAKA